MRHTAVAVTTIDPVASFPLLRQCSRDAQFFVAGDLKTPDKVAQDVHTLGGVYLSPDAQKKWKCSEALGWNTLARRNIAFLEALKAGAQIVVAHDVDNYPLDAAYFWNFEQALTTPFNGLAVHNPVWFDPGTLLSPVIRQRGIPHDVFQDNTVEPVAGARVGVAQGLILGDTDMSAVTRMALHPQATDVTALAHAGVVSALETWTVFNTQSTAMWHDLVPAWFLGPGLGRFDDIYASMVVQRVARERGYHIHYGQPLAFQQRHKHDAIEDLRAEISGMADIHKMRSVLDALTLPGKNVIEDVRKIYAALENALWYPAPAVVAAHAFLDDCEEVV